MIEKGLKYSVSESDQNRILMLKKTLGTSESNHIYFTAGETEARIGQVKRAMGVFFLGLETMGLTCKLLRGRQASALPHPLDPVHRHILWLSTAEIALESIHFF